MVKLSNKSKNNENKNSKQIYQKISKTSVDGQMGEVQSFICSKYSFKQKKIEENEPIKKYQKERKQFLEDKNEEEKKEIENLDSPIKDWNKKQRKESIYSDTDSTSNEDKIEKEKINSKETPFKNEKNKQEFKCTAKDFKVKYKTELCKNFMLHGYCKYGESCAFAHGLEDLRTKVTNTTAFRTKKCKQFFEKGYCPYGDRCQFAHLFRTNIINNAYDDKLMTYTKIIETISNEKNIPNLKKIVEKPRLQAFKELGKNDENIPSRLLDDIKEALHCTK